MGVGILKRRSMWRLGKDEDRPGDWSGLIRYLIGHRRIFEDIRAGVAHLVLFWGFIVSLFIVILAQFGLTLPPFPARCLSLLGDILGIAMLGGTLFFLTKRTKPNNRESRTRTILPLVLLMVILLSGFLAEAFRLRILQKGFPWFSPVGWMFSLGLPASPVFLQLSIRLHFFSVLFFVGALPYTSMRHLAAAPLNVYYRREASRKRQGKWPWDEWPLGAEGIRDFSWKQLLDAEACVSCGRCEKNCPATISGESLSPQKVVQDILEQMKQTNRHRRVPAQSPVPLLENRVTGEEVWSCTTCMACVECCPVYVQHVDKIIEMRRNRVQRQSRFPRELYRLFQNLEVYGDTFGKGVAKRKWLSSDLGIKTAGQTEDVDWLLWVGCQASFHDRARDALSALVRILKTAGIELSILGADELCCGDVARKTGNEYVFRELARKNINRLKRYNIKKIVTLCPHCFDTLKNDYPELGGHFDVRHYIHLLGKELDPGEFGKNFPSQLRIAFHDPCYLSRTNSMTGLPREFLGALPRFEIVEMEQSRSKTFCCGAGGGRIWMPEHKSPRINEIRAEQARAVGADVLITACPYCLVMLEDGARSLDTQNRLIVKDLSEVLGS